MMSVSFENPWFLAFLLALPVVMTILRLTLVDAPRAQLALSTATRCVILLLLVLSLASLLSVSRSRKLSLVLLGDLSDSVAETASIQLSNYWSRLTAKLPPQTAVGMTTFAITNQALAPLASAPRLTSPITKPAQGGDTAIERALFTASQALPAGTLHRVALLSDGNETVGDARAAARRAAAHGLRVFSAAYTNEVKEEVLLEDLVVPSEVKKGASFSVMATAQANAPTQAGFTLYRDGFKVQEKEIDLKAGANTLMFQETKAKERGQILTASEGGERFLHGQ
jgi:hypothetical protein